MALELIVAPLDPPQGFVKPGTRRTARSYRHRMRRLLALVPSLVLAASSLVVAPAQAEPVEVWYHDLGGTGVAEPRIIHTAFNSSPYYDKLVWTGWGEEKAVGRGILDNSCAACGGEKKIDAVLRFKGFRTCDDGTLVYERARARLTFDDGTTRTRRVVNPCQTPGQE